MNKTLGTILLGFSMSTPLLGEVTFNWSESQLSKEKQRQVEQCVRKAADKFTEAYADLGAYNFKTAPERYTCIVENTPDKGEYFMGVKGGLLCIDEGLVNSPKELEVVSSFLWSCAYDSTFANLFQKQGMEKKAVELRQRIWSRGREKAHLYEQEMKKK